MDNLRGSIQTRARNDANLVAKIQHPLEQNLPALGFNGSRLSITVPGIYFRPFDPKLLKARAWPMFGTLIHGGIYSNFAAARLSFEGERQGA